jgi:hypothetical protein
MGVRQQQGIDLGRVESERLGVGLFFFAGALKHAAVDQYLVFAAANEMTRPRDLLGRAMAAVEHGWVHGQSLS